LVCLFVVGAAEEPEVVEVGVSAVNPAHGVVCIGPPGWSG